MNKIAKWSAMAILTGAFLFCIFGAVAALDELARLPFYNTLPVIALLMNAVSLFIFFPKRSRIENAFAKLASRSAISFRHLASSLGGFGQQPISASLSAGINTNNRIVMPSPQKIEAALMTIHSVAWGFPTRNRVIAPTNQEEQDNDETRQ